MDAEVRERVRLRAGSCCEYCRLPQEATPQVSHHVEHIVARQHGGTDADDNLALACDRCNAYKGPNLTAIAHQSGKVVELFHPRKHQWTEHFEIKRGQVYGKTEIGEATEVIVAMHGCDIVAVDFRP